MMNSLLYDKAFIYIPVYLDEVPFNSGSLNEECTDEVYEDWCARVIQHETDHLFQKMYIDYVEKNTEINDILQKIKKGEIVPDYDYVQNINNEFNAV